MVDQDLEKLKYPIGAFQAAAHYTPEIISESISHIESLADKLEAAVDGLSDEQLDTPYRPGGWTVRQVMHHLADSHMNSYMRFKLALTENNPTIKPYDEVTWAEELEAKHAPINVSLELIRALHNRWVIVLRNMKTADFEKTFFHPDNKKTYRLDTTVGIYDWHSRHHIAHITNLKARMSW